jgi:hypothetical protein
VYPIFIVLIVAVEKSQDELGNDRGNMSLSQSMRFASAQPTSQHSVTEVP